MIAHRTVLCVGAGQLINWGVLFYLIGVFGDLIMAELGWDRPLVYGGFSAALLTMGLASPLIGALIDRAGGRIVMAAGSGLGAAGCTALAVAESVVSYYAAWIVLGLAMRATLYDAAFASLARIGGAAARRPIAQITLLGGLASTCFWPLGHLLAAAFGVRGALLCYAAIALLTLPLQLALPAGPGARDAPSAAADPEPALPLNRGDRMVAGLLYAVVLALCHGLSSAMSAHMIGILAELGLGAALAVSVASLRGIGQSTSRLAQILFGGRIDPISLNIGATLALPVCFALCLIGGGYPAAAGAFAFLYGAGNGLVTITGGTMPLILFGFRTYGAHVGKLLVPSFAMSAAAPLAFAVVIARFGADGALYLSIAMSAAAFAAAAALKLLTTRRRGAIRQAAPTGE